MVAQSRSLNKNAVRSTSAPACEIRDPLSTSDLAKLDLGDVIADGKLYAQVGVLYGFGLGV